MPHQVDFHVGRRIRHRRWLLGMTQLQLAEAISIKFQQVQKYEAAITRVSASRLWDIAAAQSVMVSYYFEELQDASSDTTIVPKDLDERILNRDTIEFVSAVYKLPIVQRKRIVELVRALALDGHS